MTELCEYGLTPRISGLAGAFPGLDTGRVLSQERGGYLVVGKNGEAPAAVSGALRHRASGPEDYPAVGDFVMLSPGGAGERGVIHSVLPRKSVFIRKAAGTSGVSQVVAANVDLLFLCMALNGDFSLRRLERYLSLGWESGATPVVVLTKSDLCADLSEILPAVGRAAPGTEVLAVSSMEEDGAQAVARLMARGVTAAFLGSSGVGKSTLINRLLGEERLDTGGLRDDGKGRHTTTRRQLLRLPGGGLVIDTPGMRELGMWGADEGLCRAFADVEDIASRCRFGDCSHSGEPGCAVRAALESGELSPGRWQSYQALLEENSRSGDLESRLQAKREKFRRIAMENRSNKKR